MLIGPRRLGESPGRELDVRNEDANQFSRPDLLGSPPERLVVVILELGGHQFAIFRSRSAGEGDEVRLVDGVAIAGGEDGLSGEQKRRRRLVPSLTEERRKN